MTYDFGRRELLSQDSSGSGMFSRIARSSC